MFKRHLLGYQGHQTAPGYKDGTPGINRRMKKIRETILPRICQRCRTHRTPTTSKHSHLPPTFANKDGQHRATPCSMPQQPAFSNVMHLFLAQFEDDVKHQCLHQQETPPPLNSSDSSRAHSPSRSSANQIQQSIRTGREALLEIDNASPRPHTWITTMVGYDTGSKCTWLTLVKAIPLTLMEAVVHQMEIPAYKM